MDDTQADGETRTSTAATLTPQPSLPLCRQSPDSRTHPGREIDRASELNEGTPAAI